MPHEDTAPGVYVEEVNVRATIEGVETSTAAFAGRAPRGPLAAGEGPLRVRGALEFEQAFGTAHADWPLGLAVRDFFDHGGRDAWMLRLHADAGANGGSAMGPALQAADYIGDGERGTGLHALAKVAAFNLLCIPPDLAGQDIAPEVWQAALAHCVARRAMLLVDAPVAWERDDGWMADPAQALAALGLQGEGARNAALYFPRLVQENANGPVPRAPRAACGAVAGVFAATDATRGVWKAPAGVHALLQPGLAPARLLDDEQQALVNPQAVNCLRQFPHGSAIWGARTLAGGDARADDYKYVPVRRLALYIEESVSRGIEWAVFEPNGETLWARLRSDIANFMHGLWRAGAFQGTTPSESFFVKCDAGTMTQDDIDNGRCIVLVGFAPLKPAEFVVLRIAQVAMAADPPP